MSKVGIKSNDLVQSAIAKASYYDNMTLRDERVGRKLDQIPRQSTPSTMIMVKFINKANKKLTRKWSACSVNSKERKTKSQAAQQIELRVMLFNSITHDESYLSLNIEEIDETTRRKESTVVEWSTGWEQNVIESKTGVTQSFEVRIVRCQVNSVNGRHSYII